MKCPIDLLIARRTETHNGVRADARPRGQRHRLDLARVEQRHGGVQAECAFLAGGTPEVQPAGEASAEQPRFRTLLRPVDGLVSHAGLRATGRPPWHRSDRPVTPNSREVGDPRRSSCRLDALEQRV
jgi:hypothetical protein